MCSPFQTRLLIINHIDQCLCIKSMLIALMLLVVTGILGLTTVVLTDSLVNALVNSNIEEVIKKIDGNPELSCDQRVAIFKLAADQIVSNNGTDFGRIALCYEKGLDYHNAASYYKLAKNHRKALENAEKAKPKDYALLVDLYLDVGNSRRVSVYLDSLYTQSPDTAYTYFQKTGKLLVLREYAIRDSKVNLAILTYGDYTSLKEIEKDELLDLYQKAGDKAGFSKLVNQRISDLQESKKSLTLADYDTLIKYYSVLGNTARVTEYQNKANARKVDIAKAEKFWIGKSYSFSSKQVYGDMFWNYQIMPDHKASEKTEDYYYYDGVKGPSSYRTKELTWEVDEADTNTLILSNGNRLVNKDGKVSLIH